jgi:hypothetical protein
MKQKQAIGQGDCGPRMPRFNDRYLGLPDLDRRVRDAQEDTTFQDLAVVTTDVVDNDRG